MKKNDDDVFKVKGKVVCVMPKIKINTKKGITDVQEYAIETFGEYPQTIAFSVYGIDKINKFNIHNGDDLSVCFNVRSQNIGGKWFTYINAYSVLKIINNKNSNNISKNKLDSLPF